MSEIRLKRREVAAKQSEYKTAKNGFLENIRDRERLRPAGSDDSHKFWAEESSGLYAFFLSVSSIGKNGIIKAKDFSQLRKILSDRKIAEEPAESLARHQNCQFRENIRGTTFKGSQLLKLLQAQKKEVRKAQRFTDFSFHLVPKGRLELP